MKGYIKAHWAFQIGNRILQQRNKEKLTFASGITPSGVVHVGNFREIITVFFVKKAIEYLNSKKKVEFIFSWDDYDVFRKVPSDIPHQEIFNSYLGESISSIPTPYQSPSLSKEDESWLSYANYHQKNFEKSIEKIAISPKFLYQNQKYQNCEYAEFLKIALQKRKEIIEILNAYRTNKLDESWYPISIFCSACGKNHIVIDSYDGEYQIEYNCNHCEHKEEIDFRENSGVKLLWRIDWPMRWAYQQVDFEPGGKDHSSEGGSFTTAKEISEKIFNFTPPIYLAYDFVGIKGIGGKISSSKGNVITLEDVLRVYEPEVLRYLFASYRVNVEFSISFDLDVLRIYEDFDQLEKKFYGVEECSAKKIKQVEAIYLLSCEEKFFLDQENFLKKKQQSCPQRASFRHLTNILQIHNFDREKVIDYYVKNDRQFSVEKNLSSLEKRIDCATYWIKNYAPEDFCFALREKNNFDFSSLKKENSQMYFAFQKIKENFLKEEDNSFFLSGKRINDYLYDIIREFDLEKDYFFKSFYLLLLNKEKGPKLGHFLSLIRKEKIISLLP